MHVDAMPVTEAVQIHRTKPATSELLKLSPNPRLDQWQSASDCCVLAGERAGSKPIPFLATDNFRDVSVLLHFFHASS